MNHLTAAAQIVQLITALLALLAAWQARRAAKQSDANKDAIAEVHGLVNSQTAKLIEVSKLAATQAGEAAGVESERVRTEKENKK